MGETADEITHHITETREDLASNLQELETRVKAATDWREQFRRHPGWMIAAAMAGGVLLALTTRR
jgi:hypothetical protein